MHSFYYYEKINTSKHRETFLFNVHYLITEFAKDFCADKYYFVILYIFSLILWSWLSIHNLVPVIINAFGYSERFSEYHRRATVDLAVLKQ